MPSALDERVCRIPRLYAFDAFTDGSVEYIGQLEGEVAMKAQESNNLRQENQALMQENERYRGLIETLLRHPAFTPFINDISKDPSSLLQNQPRPQQQPQPQPQPQQHPAPAPQPQQNQQHQSQSDMKPDFLNFDAGQLQIPQTQPEPQQVNLAMIPEENFSKLNINGFQGYNNFNSVNAYAVTDLPQGPDPVDLLIDSPARPPHFDSAAVSTTTYTAPSSGLDVLLAKLDRAASSLNSTRT